MKIGTRMPPFSREIGFDAYAEWLAENGFEAVDTPRLTEEIVATCRRLGLTIGTCDCDASGLLSADAAERRRGLDSLKRDLSAIAQYGGTTYFALLSPSDPSLGRAKNFEIWKEAYPDVVVHAEKEGVRIAVEPWPGPGPWYGNLGCTPEMWRAMFEEIPSSNLGLSFDPSHLVRIQVDYVRALHEFGDRVHHVHLKDTEIVQERLYESGILGPSFDSPYGYGDGWWRYVIPGEGEIDWNLVIRRLEEVGYDGVLSVELEDHHFTATPELQKEGLLRAKEYVAEFLKGRE